MIEGKFKRQMLLQYLNESVDQIRVVANQTTQLATRGRLPSQSSSATLIPQGTTLRLAAIAFDEQAQGGRGDFTLTLTPMTPEIWVSATASVNQESNTLRFVVDGAQGTFSQMVDHMLAKELKPGVTALDVIEHHAREHAAQEFANNRGSNPDYGTW